jgi:hypothetical protein
VDLHDFPTDHADKDCLLTDDLDGLEVFLVVLFALGAGAVLVLICWAVWRLF